MVAGLMGSDDELILTPEDKAVLFTTVIENPYIPHKPFRQQAEFLLSTEEEVFYGGAAGGGKSDALLMAALQYVEAPWYSALILRRTYPELTQEGGLIDRSHEWLGETDAEWSESRKQWTFPTGATLQFGHMEYEKDKYRYQGSAYHFIGFDELTQFTETQYRFMFRSLRKDADDWLPLRMRATGNPGGPGHDWVKERFIEGDKRFIPSTWRENPYLDRESYERALNELDWITRRQLRDGDWYTNPQGGLFQRDWFSVHDEAPRVVDAVRFWDLAATKPTGGSDPDYTVGLLLGKDESGDAWVLDVRRIRGTPREVERLIVQTAQVDGPDIRIRKEEEGGASGKMLTEHFRGLLAGYDFRGVRPVGDKYARARPVSSYAEAGRIHLLRGPWVKEFLDEVEAFPMDGVHDDQVDALSGAFRELFMQKKARILIPRRR